MRRQSAHQLSLPRSVAEAVNLQAKVTRYAGLLDDLHTQLTTAQVSLARCEAELGASRAECTRLLSENRHLALKCLGFGRSPDPSPPSPPLDALDRTFRRLLAVCHPDKWAQGQDATLLAHELTVALNAVRATLGEGRG